MAKVCADRGLELQKRRFNKPVTDLYHRALDFHPQCYDALNNISVILIAAGRLNMAIGLFRRAVAANDRMPVAYGNLANVLMDTEHMEATVEQLGKLVKIHPNFSVARINLGRPLWLYPRVDKAIDPFHRALELGGDEVEAQEALGNVFKSQSRLDKARHHFRKALDINCNNGSAIKLSLSFPVIANSKSQLESERRRLEREVEALLNRETTEPEPFASPDVTNFHTAYMGLGDRALQEKVDRLFRKSTRSLYFVADHCRTPKPAAKFKIRIRFISIRDVLLDPLYFGGAGSSAAGPERMSAEGRYIGFDPNASMDTGSDAFEPRCEKFVPARYLVECRPDLIISRHVLEQLVNSLGFL